MLSGGLFQATPGMRDALTKPEPAREWLEAMQDRCQRRMHSGDAAALRDEVDQLRSYVAALFQLLVARGAFTVEEAQRLVVELEAANSAPNESRRDVVSGAEKPPEENPFYELSGAGESRRKGWRAWFRLRTPEACVLAATFGAAMTLLLAWLIR